MGRPMASAQRLPAATRAGICRDDLPDDHENDLEEIASARAARAVVAKHPCCLTDKRR